MDETIERQRPRMYNVQLAPNGDSSNYPAVISVWADVLCERGENHIEFKREGKIVGIVKAPIIAWWIEERTP